ncbi:MAG: divalent metal cation transporter [Thermoprotei archaeon]
MLRKQQTLVEFAKNFGPAWLVMMADVDAASIITGLQDGSSWGYRMVFVMLALTIPLFIVQDAAGRLGVAGGMGLAKAIKEKYGGRIATLAAIPMGVSDFLEYVAEYAGIAIGLSILGLPIVAGVAAAYAAHTFIVLFKKYRQAEIILLPISFLLVGSILGSLGFLNINLHTLLSTGFTPLQPYSDPGYDYLLAASIGSVIMPWMLYFHSGADARRNKPLSSLRSERMETLIGAFISEALMAAIVVVGAHIPMGDTLLGVDSFANILPQLGDNTHILIGLGFLFAGFLALVVISLGSAWGVLEALGRESRSSFLAVYIVESLPAVALVLFVSSYVQLMLTLMVIYTIIIVPSLYFLGRVVSDSVLLGHAKYARGEIMLYWAMVLFIVFGGALGVYSILF